MAEKAQQIPIYTLGDTIRIELKASDESGVKSVSAYFVLTDSDTSGSMLLEAEGYGQQSAEMVIEKAVDGEMVPGHYVCQYLSLYDLRNNRTTETYPGIEFSIEGIPGDRRGPKLESWKVVDLTEDEQRLLQALYQRQSSNVQPEIEMPAHEAGVENHEKAWRELVERGYARSREYDDGDVYLEITERGIEKLRSQ